MHATDLYQTKKRLMKLASTVFLLKSLFVFAILNILLLCLSLVPSLIFYFYLHLLYLLCVNKNVNNGDKRNSTQESVINEWQLVSIPLVRWATFCESYFVWLDFENVLRFNSKNKNLYSTFCTNFSKKSWLLPWILFAPKTVPVHDHFTALLRSKNIFEFQSAIKLRTINRWLWSLLGCWEKWFCYNFEW